ncbi:MAG: rRNA maturation RNase YbeY [Candidatus Pelagibacter sp. TMED165]|nr:MAG: rRNA maturation RNase YbeY [Candidatus Pelagibacter sp. TMED165]|tara:strand:+ start:123 stop:590 length:468 start_codon:yes stop_codon:yes gene_type:complete
MIKINVIIQDNKWKKYIKKPNIYLKKKFKVLEKKIKILKNNKLELSILLSGDEEIKKLNLKFRNKNKTTDVLSFPFFKKKDFKLKLKKRDKFYLGDIIININKIKKNNKNLDFKNNFDFLWIHGFAHLLGYQHKKNKDYLSMRKIEKTFLNLVKS